MEYTVMTKKGAKTDRKVKLQENVFNIEPNKHVLSLDIINKQQTARQGTAKSKEKSEITASTKKPYKQKGTGRARVGSKKSPIWRGGGRIFGPKPRDYGFNQNKKEKRLALKSALTIKNQQKQIIVIEDFTFDKPSTKAYLEMVRSLKITDEKILWLLPSVQREFLLSVRNVPKNDIKTVASCNTYQLLYATKVVCFESALPLIYEKFA